MTLTEFLQGTKPSAPYNAHVDFPWFKTLYVRRRPRLLGGVVRKPVLDLANIEAKKPGKGAFTQLLKFMARRHPKHWIFVECVHNERFAAALIGRWGFTQENVGQSLCFYLQPKDSP